MEHPRDDAPDIEVRVLRDTGQYLQRSAVFASGGFEDVLIWMINAGGTAVVGGAAVAGVQRVRGFAMSRQRGGSRSDRLTAETVAREFLAAQYGVRVGKAKADEMASGGVFRFTFENTATDEVFVVELRSESTMRGRRSSVTGVRRSPGAKTDD